MNMNARTGIVWCWLTMIGAWVQTSVASASVVPGYSDVLRLGENSYLVVNDRKTPRDVGGRIGTLTITPVQGAVYSTIDVADWRHPDGPPSDLEACCLVSAAADGPPEVEVLLLESGRFDQRFGRVFHLKLSIMGAGIWAATVAQVFKLDTVRPGTSGDGKEREYDGYEIEGAACLRLQERVMLVYGERGGKVVGGPKVGTIVWGTLDLEAGVFARQDEAPLVEMSVLGERDCAALLLRGAGQNNTMTVYAVASRDATGRDKDNGPFRSMVYRAGNFTVDPTTFRGSFQRDFQAIATMDGFKVEGLAEGPGSAGDDFCIVTDDENLGGVWRSFSVHP